MAAGLIHASNETVVAGSSDELRPLLVMTAAALPPTPDSVTAASPATSPAAPFETAEPIVILCPLPELSSALVPVSSSRKYAAGELARTAAEYGLLEPTDCGSML